MNIALWIVGASALYLGIGSFIAYQAHQTYRDGIYLRDWLHLLLMWPRIFFLGK